MFETTNQIMYFNVVDDLGNDLGLHFFKGRVLFSVYGRPSWVGRDEHS
jgi:hypothetical protein